MPMPSPDAPMVSREKYWGERSADEKVEALANCLRRLADSHYRLLCKMERMESHSHDGAGRVTVPIARDEGLGFHNWAHELRERPR